MSDPMETPSTAQAAPGAQDLLSAICMPDHVNSLVRQPWDVVVDGRPYTAATDGVRILCVAGASDTPPAPNPKLLGYAAGAPRPTHEVDLPALIAAVGAGPAACPACKDAQAGECWRCDGTGEIECNLGHDHECPDCDGRGVGEPHCNGPGPHLGRDTEIQPVVFGDLPPIIDARRLRGIITALPPPVTIGANDQLIALRGAGWLFIVMGLRCRDGVPVAMVPVTAISLPDAAP